MGMLKFNIVYLFVIYVSIYIIYSVYIVDIFVLIYNLCPIKCVFQQLYSLD